MDLAESDAALAEHLREELLNRAWKRLHEFRSTYYLALRMRVEQPDLPARELAQQLTAELDKPVSPDTVRKTLERARRKFADLLVGEVEASMDSPSDEQLHHELRDLDLLRYCRSAVERRSSQE